MRFFKDPSRPAIRQPGRGKPFAGKDIAPACKIKHDARAASAEAAPSSSIAGKTS
jgi:benzoate membrane transport protein